MDFMSGTIFSGIIYDMLKHQMALTAENIKNRTKEWIIEDLVAIDVAEQLKSLQLSDEMSEKAIERKIISSDGLLALMKNIKPESSTTIMQKHNGSGDNIGRDKVINNNL